MRCVSDFRKAPVEIALGDAFLGMQRIEASELCLLDPPELFLEPLRSKPHRQPSPQHSSDCGFPRDMPNKPCLDPLAPEVVDPDNQPELAESREIVSVEVAGSGSDTVTESGNQAQQSGNHALLTPVTVFQVQSFWTESGPQQQLIPLFQWTLPQSGPQHQQQLMPLTAVLAQWAVQQQPAAAAVAAEAPEAPTAAEAKAEAATPEEAVEEPGSPQSHLVRASTAASSGGAASSSGDFSSAAPSRSASSSGLNPNASTFRSGREVRDGIWMHVAWRNPGFMWSRTLDVGKVWCRMVFHSFWLGLVTVWNESRQNWSEVLDQPGMPPWTDWSSLPYPSWWGLSSMWSLQGGRAFCESTSTRQRPIEFDHGLLPNPAQIGHG